MILGRNLLFTWFLLAIVLVRARNLASLPPAGLSFASDTHQSSLSKLGSMVGSTDSSLLSGSKEIATIKLLPKTFELASMLLVEFIQRERKYIELNLNLMQPIIAPIPSTNRVATLVMSSFNVEKLEVGRNSGLKLIRQGVNVVVEDLVLQLRFKYSLKSTKQTLTPVTAATAAASTSKRPFMSRFGFKSGDKSERTTLVKRAFLDDTRSRARKFFSSIFSRFSWLSRKRKANNLNSKGDPEAKHKPVTDLTVEKPPQLSSKAKIAAGGATAVGATGLGVGLSSADVNPAIAPEPPKLDMGTPLSSTSNPSSSFEVMSDASYPSKGDVSSQSSSKSDSSSSLAAINGASSLKPPQPVKDKVKRGATVVSSGVVRGVIRDSGIATVLVRIPRFEVALSNFHWSHLGFRFSEVVLPDTNTIAPIKLNLHHSKPSPLLKTFEPLIEREITRATRKILPGAIKKSLGPLLNDMMISVIPSVAFNVVVPQSVNSNVNVQITSDVTGARFSLEGMEIGLNLAICSRELGISCHPKARKLNRSKSLKRRAVVSEMFQQVVHSSYSADGDSRKTYIETKIHPAALQVVNSVMQKMVTTYHQPRLLVAHVHGVSKVTAVGNMKWKVTAPTLTKITWGSETGLHLSDNEIIFKIDNLETELNLGYEYGKTSLPEMPQVSFSQANALQAGLFGPKDTYWDRGTAKVNLKIQRLHMPMILTRNKAGAINFELIKSSLKVQIDKLDVKLIPSTMMGSVLNSASVVYQRFFKKQLLDMLTDRLVKLLESQVSDLLNGVVSAYIPSAKIKAPFAPDIVRAYEFEASLIGNPALRLDGVILRIYLGACDSTGHCIQTVFSEPRSLRRIGGQRHRDFGSSIPLQDKEIINDGKEESPRDISQKRGFKAFTDVFASS